MCNDFGFWPSPITAEAVSKGIASYSFTEIEGDNFYWIETRPDGRSMLMSLEGELTPSPYNVRSRVHEYGGRPYAVFEGNVYFINFHDQALYRIQEGRIDQITDGSVYFAELIVSEFGIIAVAERRGAVVDNFLALIDPITGAIATLASGHDFYGSPALSPDGKKMAWITWDHPNMPWDGTDLWVADFNSGKLVNPVHIAGGLNESIFQPGWSPSGKLHYVSDISGWWNLYRYEGTALYPCAAEFGVPLWVLGMRTYGFDGEDVIASYQKEGRWGLVRIDADGLVSKLDFQASHIHSFTVSCGKALFIASQVIVLDLASGNMNIVRTSETSIDPGFCSEGMPIEFPGKGSHFVKAYYYPPVNKDCTAPINTKPPLIVKAHGGPTAQCNNSFSWIIQYWTSRGFAVVDVNYGGSSGYGREYRDLLKKQWGIIDWEDCESSARYLIAEGLVDPEKIFIEGSSAGGYTVLSALTFGTVFTAGASYYGISDLSLLTRETHKFESRYMDQLIGPYPEYQAVYEARSPIMNQGLLKSPVILFQGEEDQVVPPNQAKEFYEILIDRGIKAELVLYPSEQHGFRKAETIQDALEKELAFYLNGSRSA